MQSAFRVCAMHDAMQSVHMCFTVKSAGAARDIVSLLGALRAHWYAHHKGKGLHPGVRPNVNVANLIIYTRTRFKGDRPAGADNYVTLTTKIQT